jgi:hypothetical protein
MRLTGGDPLTQGPGGSASVWIGERQPGVRSIFWPVKLKDFENRFPENDKKLPKIISQDLKLQKL